MKRFFSVTLIPSQLQRKLGMDRGEREVSVALTRRGLFAKISLGHDRSAWRRTASPSSHTIFKRFFR